MKAHNKNYEMIGSYVPYAITLLTVVVYLGSLFYMNT
jgi:hypothetical protein